MESWPLARVMETFTFRRVLTRGLRRRLPCGGSGQSWCASSRVDPRTWAEALRVRAGPYSPERRSSWGSAVPSTLPKPPESLRPGLPRLPASPRAFPALGPAGPARRRRTKTQAQTPSDVPC